MQNRSNNKLCKVCILQGQRETNRSPGPERQRDIDRKTDGQNNARSDVWSEQNNARSEMWNDCIYLANKPLSPNRIVNTPNACASGKVSLHVRAHVRACVFVCICAFFCVRARMKTWMQSWTRKCTIVIMCARTHTYVNVFANEIPQTQRATRYFWHTFVGMFSNQWAGKKIEGRTKTHILHSASHQTRKTKLTISTSPKSEQCNKIWDALLRTNRILPQR